jgi:hypothetical protein
MTTHDAFGPDRVRHEIQPYFTRNTRLASARYYQHQRVHPKKAYSHASRA